jgi:hypothetical protein
MKITTYTEYTKLSFKDIESLLITVSEQAARQYLSDIKKEYGLKAVLFCHFKQYFKIAETSQN